MNSHAGKIILALTTMLLVQHGVRHLLFADDRDQANKVLPLLDTGHPFPSLPPKTSSKTQDRTPIRTVIAAHKGQVVAISSLDRSIQLHDFELSVSTSALPEGPGSDQIWFDFARATLPRSSTDHQRPPSRISVEKPRDSFAPSRHRQDLADPQEVRRFHLPFFRSGRVYERPLIRNLIDFSDQIAIYGNPRNQQHVEMARAIQACGIVDVLDFIERKIGKISDLDGNDRLTLVLGQLADPILADSEAEPIRGCVRPADFQPGRPMSADVVYLNPEHLLVDELQSLLAHEFAHAATFSALVQCDQSPTEMPGWLNEAIAHNIEEQLAPQSRNLQLRRQQFQTQPWLYPSMIPRDVAGIELRRGPVRIASLELLKAAMAIGSGKELRQLITERGTGISRLQSVTGSTFPEIFRKFTLQQTVKQQSAALKEESLRTAFDLDNNQQQTIQIRGTATGVSTPAKSQCFLTITTTRDAMPQVTLIDLEDSE